MVEPEFHEPNSSYKQYVEKYWTKILETPNDQNPATDPDGSRHDVTTDPVYLACSMIGTVTRKLPDISGEQNIFIAVNPVEICERELRSGENEDDLHKHAKKDEDTASKAILEIDGKKYLQSKEKNNLLDDRYRIRNVGPFEVEIPDNPLEGLGYAGKCKVAADGYYVMIKPLAPGPHTIRYVAKVDGPHGESAPWEQDVTCTFNVK
jgi:hypothetical protein